MLYRPRAISASREGVNRVRVRLGFFMAAFVRIFLAFIFLPPLFSFYVIKLLRGFNPQRPSGQAVVTDVFPSPPRYLPLFLSELSSAWNADTYSRSWHGYPRLRYLHGGNQKPRQSRYSNPESRHCTARLRSKRNPRYPWCSDKKTQHLHGTFPRWAALSIRASSLTAS